MKLYNTLSRNLEEFKPLKKSEIGIYSCGPTVYWNQHIGHMYAYTQWDSLVRIFKYLGFKTNWVMNITDVGHLTSDEDTGEDKMEKGAARENKSVWEIADRYIAQFKESLFLLNINEPNVMCRATDHIADQIDLIKKIESRGFTYKTKTGLVFDTSKFPGYADFGRLNLEEQKAGSRVEVDTEKKNPWDFLLWVTNQPNHIMQWDSPWGRGFPGWHIECTAMSVKYLGAQFDIHTGGKEHIGVHHTNEVAQAFGAFGRQTANFWLHNEWLTFEGEKISKSQGNSILVSDLAQKDFSSIALRYLILTSHYRSGLNFTWEGLKAAQTALNRLYANYLLLKTNQTEDGPREEVDQWEEKFVQAISNDLGLPQALALVWQVLDSKTNLGSGQKFDLLSKWDLVFGFNLAGQKEIGISPPKSIIEMAQKREELRGLGKFDQADKVREEIEKQDWIIEDIAKGYNLKPK